MEIIMATLPALIASARQLFGLQQRAPANPSKTFLSFNASTPYAPNWLQLGRDPNRIDAMKNSVVYACVSIISQEIARMHCHVWTRSDASKKRERMHPQFDRLLRRPNRYQTHSDFWLYVVSSLLLNGNAYVIKLSSSSRGEEWHPLPSNAVTAMVSELDGEVWYQLGSTPMLANEIEAGRLIPARNILHLRLYCPYHPLIGVSPIISAGLSMAQNEMIKKNSVNFFANMSRPSGILKAPESITLDEATAARIKERFASATSVENMGRPVILGAGYSWEALTVNADDAQIVQQFNMTVEDIARVFRMPTHMLNVLQNATENNVNSTQRAFVTQTLGFYLEHIESGLDAWLNLGDDEYSEYDVEAAMLRPDFKERMEAYAKAVQGGIYAPNEARNAEHLPEVEGGDRVFLQAQMVPVDADIRAAHKNPEETEVDSTRVKLIEDLREKRLQRECAASG